MVKRSEDSQEIDPLAVETLATFENLKRDIAAERRKRLREYGAAVKSLGPRRRRSARGPVKILVEGDSWFDYPLSPDTIDYLKTRLKHPELVLSLAHYGDSSKQMLSLPQRKRIIRMLSSTTYGPFDAILFSGGGNDLAGDQFCLWLADFDSSHPDPATVLMKPESAILWA